MSDQSEFLCKCKKQKGWIGEGQTTKPCPSCGRVYTGKYIKKKYRIEADEVKMNTNKVKKTK